jgi:(1->4)-alpha-D-glucan 1-alpha-D-glucosylmutase
MFTSLAQTLIKATAPGVPDTYQGTELWDFSLVDPDNRRPVDYELRGRLLAEIDRRAGHDRAGLARELLEEMKDGRIKLYVLAQALRMRRELGEVFASGQYLPIDAIGPRAGHAFCFARISRESCALVLVPRLVASLVLVPGSPPIGEDVWGETALLLPEALAGFGWRDRLAGDTFHATPERTLSVARLLGRFPVALLEGKRG